MSIAALLMALRLQDATLYVGEDGTLRYAGPPMPADSLIRAAIVQHKPLLLELFSYAPSGRCVGVGCYRLKASGKDICPGPHLLLSDLRAQQTATLCQNEAAA
jgi:hypothetical protein